MARMAGELASDPHSSLPVRVFLGALLTFTTLSVWVGSSDPWWRPKEWAALILGMGWLIGRTVWIPLVLRSGRDRLLACLMTGVLIHFFVRFIFPVIKAPGLLGQSPWPWLAFLHIAVGLVWLTDLRRIIRREDIQWAVKGMAFLGVGLALFMIAQKLGFDPLMRYVQVKYPNFRWLDPNHVIGLLGSPFMAGASLAVLVPAVTFQSRSSWIWRVFLGLCLFSCWLTGSISSFLAALSGAFAASGLITTRKRFLASAVAGLVLLGISYLLKPDIFLEHGRLSILKQAIPFIQAHPLLGVGLNRFKELGIVVMDGNPYKVWWAHNEPLHFVTELGIPLGLLLFAYLARQTLLLHRAQTALFGCSISVLVLSLFHIPFHLAPTLAVTGLCLVASHLESN